MNKDDINEDDGLYNKTGLSQRVLADLQRFLACAQVDKKSMEELVADPALLRDLKEAAGIIPTARINLMFRNAGPLRT